MLGDLQSSLSDYFRLRLPLERSCPCPPLIARLPARLPGSGFPSGSGSGPGPTGGRECLLPRRAKGGVSRGTNPTRSWEAGQGEKAAAQASAPWSPRGAAALGDGKGSRNWGEQASDPKGGLWGIKGELITRSLGGLLSSCYAGGGKAAVGQTARRPPPGDPRTPTLPRVPRATPGPCSAGSSGQQAGAGPPGCAHPLTGGQVQLTEDPGRRRARVPHGEHTQCTRVSPEGL